MKVSLIAAVAVNGVIGRDNDLPWRIKDDMRFFRETTKGRTVITGRKNFEAMGRALPNRTNIVVTRQADYHAEGALAVGSIEAALGAARSSGETEAFVIGGAEIYKQALPYADTYYRTRVLSNVDGDVIFPPIAEAEWEVSELSTHPADADNEYAFVIERLRRLAPPASY
jgi:dihydrofolate reductase